MMQTKEWHGWDRIREDDYTGLCSIFERVIRVCKERSMVMNSKFLALSSGRMIVPPINREDLIFLKLKIKATICQRLLGTRQSIKPSTDLPLFSA